MPRSCAAFRASAIWSATSADLAINCPAYACRQAGSKEGRRSLMASEWQQTSSRGILPLSQHHIWGEHGWAERGVGGRADRRMGAAEASLQVARGNLAVMSGTCGGTERGR